MMREDLTGRDRQYLKAVYVLGGQKEAVGPAMLARKMDVSRAGTLKKMKRLATKGYGDYLSGKGFLLNDSGIQAIQKDMRKHHVIEKFLQISLGLNSDDACDESSRVGQHLSDEIIQSMAEKLEGKRTCDDGCRTEPPYEPEDLMRCPWVQRQIGEGE